jgi:Tfp pilus assembly protein PilF
LRPTYAPYEVNVATALIAAGRKAEALHHLEKALRLDPLLQQAIELLSSVYKDQDESAKAAGLVAQYQHEMGITPAR